MPIEFRCPSCSRLLRTPDESVGEKAKCPQCGMITEVPATSTSGESATLPAIQKSPSEFATDNQNKLNPYASPSSNTDLQEQLPDEPQRVGLPWDNGPRSVGTYYETVKFIFSAPAEAFGQMSRSGGFGVPLKFAVISGLIGAIFSGTYTTIFQIVLRKIVAAIGPGKLPPGFSLGSTTQIALQLPIAILLGTVGVTIMLFLGGAINHYILKIVSGTKFPFETTFRVLAYVHGTITLLQIVPACGGYVAGLLAIIYSILGFAAAHRISIGRAIGAVLLYIAFVVIVVAIIAGIAVVVIVSVRCLH